MNDRNFLIWLHARLTDVHGENPLSDYMYKLRAIIMSIPADKETPNVGGGKSLDDVLKAIASENECICKASPESTDMLLIDRKCPKHGVNKKTNNDWSQEINLLNETEEELIILIKQYKSGQYINLLDCISRVRGVRDSLRHDMYIRRMDDVK